jgi:hypothetical protein
VDGVIIGDTLYAHQTFKRNLKMKNLIKEALNKEEKAIIELINFPNGGAASSYDLGYVMTQIVYRLNEEEFIHLIKDTPSKDLNMLQGLIWVGLEYGDNDYDGKMDDKRINIEFPKLNTYLNERL